MSTVSESLKINTNQIVPFGDIVVPYIDVLNVSEKFPTTSEFPQTFTINSDRLRKQLIYYSVTAQIVGFAVENFMPYFMQKAMSGAQKLKTSYNGQSSTFKDEEKEAAFLKRVRLEALLPEYDVYADYAELVAQVRNYLIIPTQV